MPHNLRHDDHATFNSLSKMCFAVAGLAFFGAFACAAINHALTGWMAVAGMASLGLFYLAIGVLNLGHASALLTDYKPESSAAATTHVHSRKHGDTFSLPHESNRGRRYECEDKVSESDKLVEA